MADIPASDAAKSMPFTPSPKRDTSATYITGGHALFSHYLGKAGNTPPSRIPLRRITPSAALDAATGRHNSPRPSRIPVSTTGPRPRLVELARPPRQHLVPVPSPANIQAPSPTPTLESSSSSFTSAHTDTVASPEPPPEYQYSTPAQPTGAVPEADVSKPRLRKEPQRFAQIWKPILRAITGCF